MCVTKPPCPGTARTLSPTLKSLTLGPILSIIPATSPPGAKGLGGLIWYRSRIISVSGKFTPAALTAMQISPSLGSLSEISVNINVSGPPGV